MSTAGATLRIFGFASLGSALLFVAITPLIATASDLPGSQRLIAAAVLLALAAASLVFGLWAVVVGSRRVARTRRVLATGHRVEAVVVDLAQSRIEVDERPMTVLTMTYRAPDGRTVTSKVTQLVPLNVANALTIGYRLPVMIDPLDPNFIVVNWGEAAAVSRAALLRTLGEAAIETVITS